MAQATAPILDSTETDMPTALRDVRSQGQSGKHMLALSFSGFDPTADISSDTQRPMRFRPAVTQKCPVSNAMSALPRSAQQVPLANE
jgi:hypothetical protein